ncbi:MULTISPECIES: O-linked N-acetylglucosamine transferase, SPINDLY family protein [Cupriavidus]|uniref:protein O-GlcNAc transferase n=1 Tax=Cupriavidus pauculus TaxID=82633 RepID=A0A5P2HFD1_9BURK|nr:tetratricopeptide repeat protein [Cupriavidus pauculus]QET05859.1 tetratricopeptide repeat protein [Cupriavidus pauculus]
MNKNVSMSPAQRLIQQAWAAHASGRFAEAIKLAGTAKRSGASLADASYIEAVAMSGLGRNAEAKALGEASLKRFPNHAGFLGMLGTLELQLENFDVAAKLLKSSLDLQPEVGHLWQAYGAAMFALGHYNDARIAGERAVALLPNDPAVVGNYASALRESGATMEAIPVMRQACALDPLQRINRSNLLFTILYDETIGAEQLRREATDWAETLARMPIDGKLPELSGSDGDKIRIGILSNDLRRHAVAYFLIPLIANIDRTRFEVHLFSLTSVTDNVTQKIRQYAESFQDVSKLKEAEVVRRIRAARCDVMVDLGGYTGASPLQYMVHRLAPKQLTWLGYPGTTGMKEIEYRVTDWTADPAGFEHNYSEKLLRAPIFSAFHPMVTNPLFIYEPKYRVCPTPALENGYITFGSCNHIAKLGPKTMRLWSAVLARCPNSRLLVEAAGCDRESVREMLRTRMEQHGIDTSRVDMIPRDGANQYLTYHRIDIALDTAPVTGGTTTCDAIWMGVPVVTFAGDTFHQRVSTPFLRAAGLDELICETEERYIEVACALASDIAQLDGIRQSIRPRAEKSEMFDAPRFATWFEDEVTEMVREFKPTSHERVARREGVFFGGTWYPAEDLVLSVAAHLHLREYGPLRNVLENLTSTWYRHWMIAYGLAEIKYAEGKHEEAIELLVEAIGMRPYALPLYRKLGIWMDEQGLDKSALAQLLDDQFGLALETLEASAVPDVFEILGITIERIDNNVAEEATA